MNRYTIAGAVLASIAAVSAAAQDAPASQWGYYEPEGAPMQAGVASPEGGQLILKCDERGEDTVFAVIVSPSRLRPPSDRPQVRSIFLRFDGGSREEFRWRYYDTSVTAINANRDSTLQPFLNSMADANTLEVRLDPTDGAPVELNFPVTGARDAFRRIFESCGDTNFVE